jgi:hypothetical protein
MNHMLRLLWNIISPYIYPVHGKCLSKTFLATICRNCIFVCHSCFVYVCVCACKKHSVLKLLLLLLWEKLLDFCERERKRIEKNPDFGIVSVPLFHSVWLCFWKFRIETILLWFYSKLERIITFSKL